MRLEASVAYCDGMVPYPHPLCSRSNDCNQVDWSGEILWYVCGEAGFLVTPALALNG